jgi:hypothetical protein
MAQPKQDAPMGNRLAVEPAAYLDMPAERRTAAQTQAAILSTTAGAVALELPLGADVDDFRRLLMAEAKP